MVISPVSKVIVVQKCPFYLYGGCDDQWMASRRWTKKKKELEKWNVFKTHKTEIQTWSSSMLIKIHSSSIKTACMMYLVQRT